MLTKEQEAILLKVMESQDATLIGEFVAGVIQEKLLIENFLDAMFAQVTGRDFLAPFDVVGKTAQKAVRGQIPETFTVGRRRVTLAEERYTSKPSMDIVDLKRGDVATLTDIITVAEQGMQDLIMLDAYNLVLANCKFGDANFKLIKDTGTFQTDGVTPAYLISLKRQLDLILGNIQDNTLLRKARSIIGRRILLSDIPGNTGLTIDNKSKFELSPDLIPLEYRGVPCVAISGATDRSGNLAFPQNELVIMSEGAGNYSIPTEVQQSTLPQLNFEQAWELLTERIIALWYKNLIWRMFIIDTTNGKFTGIPSATRNSVVIETNKYVNPTTITAVNLKVYSGSDPGAGVAGETITQIDDDGTGKRITLEFTGADTLAAGSYRVYNLATITDIGGTALAVSSHASPIGQFTIV